MAGLHHNKPQSRAAWAETCLEFFEVPTVRSWQKYYEPLQKSYAFKTSTANETSPASVAAWLRQGEVVGSRIQCEPWNSEGFTDSLSEIRSLTRKKDPEVFIPQLQKICASHGVALVVLQTTPNCPVSGAARFISENRALIIVSARYLSDDNFWFTFFHEVAHLLLHSKSKLFVDADFDVPSNVSSAVQEEEDEANRFAELTLIPAASQSDFHRLPAAYKDVIRFANNIDIAPGIVVGQLQFKKRVDRSWLNKLKRFYRWRNGTLCLRR